MGTPVGYRRESRRVVVLFRARARWWRVRSHSLLCPADACARPPARPPEQTVCDSGGLGPSELGGVARGCVRALLVT